MTGYLILKIKFMIKWLINSDSANFIYFNIISYKVIEDMDPKFSILYYLALFVILMDRKTKYGEMISVKVNGFREFLLMVEKTKLELLVS